MPYSNLDPLLQVARPPIKIHVLFYVIHKETQVILMEGDAVFENGKSLVLTHTLLHSITGAIKSIGTLDHTLHWVHENPEYLFCWQSADHVRIEDDR